MVRCSTCTTRTRCLANINGYFFSLLYAHVWYVLLYLNEKYAKNMKSKKNQYTFKYGCKSVSRRCRSYMIYLKGDGLHQTVMVVYECSWFSYIIIFIWWHAYAFLQKFHTQHVHSLLLLILLYRYTLSQGIHVVV